MSAAADPTCDSTGFTQHSHRIYPFFMSVLELISIVHFLKNRPLSASLLALSRPGFSFTLLMSM
jgi:hypothetical protein